MTGDRVHAHVLDHYQYFIDVTQCIILKRGSERGHRCHALLPKEQCTGQKRRLKE